MEKNCRARSSLNRLVRQKSFDESFEQINSALDENDEGAEAKTVNKINQQPQIQFGNTNLISTQQEEIVEVVTTEITSNKNESFSMIKEDSETNLNGNTGFKTTTRVTTTTTTIEPIELLNDDLNMINGRRSSKSNDKLDNYKQLQHQHTDVSQIREHDSNLNGQENNTELDEYHIYHSANISNSNSVHNEASKTSDYSFLSLSSNKSKLNISPTGSNFSDSSLSETAHSKKSSTNQRQSTLQRFLKMKI
jgi:hypothetical protein